MKKNRIYHNHEKWEDFKNGLYRKHENDLDFYVEKAYKILSDYQFFYFIMEKMLIEWKYCIEHNLTNYSINRRAYLGAAACNFECNCNEISVRIAWSKLTSEMKHKANLAAEKIIRKYNPKNKNIQLCLELIWN